MKVAEVQKKTAAKSQIQAKREPFFNKDGKDSFFSKSNESTQSFFNGPTIQTKLTIGEPNDKYEVEADATADKVVQKLSEPKSNSPFEGSKGGAVKSNSIIQKKCSDCEEKEKLQKKENEELLQNKLEIQRKPIFESNAEAPEADVQTKLISTPIIQAKCSKCEEEEKLQKKEEQSDDEMDVQAKSTDSPTEGSPDLQTSLNSSKGGGSSLSSDTQSSMGSAFGADFSKVRIHTGTEAVQMNKQLGAQAFTHGNDIYFNEGKYDTNSSSGKHLLAHELTHTVQQGASVQKKPDVQLAEEVDKEELERQIKESNKEQKDAFDPSEAIKTQDEAVKEGEQAEQLANDEVPEVEPAKPEPLPDVDSDGSRVAVAIPKTPDTVVPAAKKKKAPKPKNDASASEANVGGEAPASGAETAEAPVVEKGGETLEYLENQSAGVCNEGAKKSQELADNESAHDTAEEKTAQTDVAVEPPTEEGQSRSNADQVNTLEGAEEPKANDAEIKSEMNKAISDAVPSKVKELNEFESEKKAQVIGNKVLAGTTKQVGDIKGTYNEIETAPPPAESPVPEALPEIEKAPDTANLNLGKGAVPAVPKEQTDLSSFEEEADGIYEKEGVSKDMQAEFENVDSGDIAEANKEKTTLKDKVANEPANLQSFAAQQQNKVETDLQNEEEKAKSSMEEKRKNELDGAKIEQEKTKSELEIKRENVTKWINDRYKLAEDVVTKKLSNLETQALNKFDIGQKKHSKQFESNVKRRVNAWKSDRYSGFWGGVKWLKDKFVGIDHFPEIKQIFTSERETFVKAVDLLIVNINLENEKTIKSCKDEIVNAKKEIQKYIDDLGPELKEAGKKGQEETTKKLEALDKHVEDEKKKLQQKLCDKKDEAIKAIDKKIEEMKSEMSGLVGKLGALLLYAAKKFFKWAIEKLGGNSDKIIGLLDKGATVLKKLFTDPIGFFKNLVKAVGGGINGFVTNIVSWLKKGLVGWLMGQMGDSGLELPQKFDMKGIIFMGLQVAGLTWNVIRPRIVKGLGPKGEAIMTAAEKGVDVIKRVIKEGPIALWDIIMEQAGEIKTKVMEGIRNWAITQIIKKMSIKLLSMLNPAGAIVQAIMLLYDVVMFFVDNWDRIIDFVKSVFDSIGAIASGAIGQAAGFIEKTLGNTIPMILSFAARFVGLSGIGKAIRKVIETIQKPFKKILDKMVKFLVKQANKLFGKGKGKGKEKDGKYTQKDKNQAKKAIPLTEKQMAKDGKVSEEEANKTASSVKKKYPVVKSIKPIIKNKTYNYNVIFRMAEEITTPLPAEVEEESAISMKRLQEKRNTLSDKFTRKEYQNSFTPNLTDKQGRMDLELGVSKNIITKTGQGRATKYEFDPMSEEEMIQIGAMEAKKGARKNTSLNKEAGFTPVEFQTYLVGLDQLPDDKTTLTLPIVEKIIENLIASKEVVRSKGKSNEFTFSEIPAKREIPEAWKKSASGSGRSASADNIRWKYYLNGASPSWEKAETTVIERDLGLIEDAITKMESTDNTEKASGKLLWARLKIRKMVPDEPYKNSAQGGGLNYYKSMARNVDHEPAMAKHWNDTGWNTPWSIRKDYATSVENTLTYILKSENLKKLGDGHNFTNKWYVGPSFTGPGQEKGSNPGPQWADVGVHFENMKNYSP